jgi:hypothetical protein
VECSPNGYGTPQAQVCNDLDIKSYPTWIIKGKRIEKVMTMTELSNETGFTAPAQ